MFRRQAYRYVREAQALEAPVATSAPTVAITIKTPRDVVAELRAYARSRG